jgi:hypothetical protein
VHNAVITAGILKIVIIISWKDNVNTYLECKSANQSLVKLAVPAFTCGGNNDEDEE